MKLARIICGNNKPNKWVEPIKRYKVITGNAGFMCPVPCQVEELDGRLFIYDISEIAYIDESKAVGTLGGTRYKIPNEYIKGVE